MHAVSAIRLWPADLVFQHLLVVLMRHFNVSRWFMTLQQELSCLTHACGVNSLCQLQTMLTGLFDVLHCDTQNRPFRLQEIVRGCSMHCGSTEIMTRHLNVWKGSVLTSHLACQTLPLPQLSLR